MRTVVKKSTVRVFILIWVIRVGGIRQADLIGLSKQPPDESHWVVYN